MSRADRWREDGMRFVDGHLGKSDEQQACGKLVADKGGYEPEQGTSSERTVTRVDRSGEAYPTSGLSSYGSVAIFKDGALKLPDAGACRVQPDEPLPRARVDSLLIGAGILHDENCEGSSTKSYVDPVLRRGGYDYGHFWQQLLESGLISLFRGLLRAAVNFYSTETQPRSLQ